MSEKKDNYLQLNSLKYLFKIKSAHFYLGIVFAVLSLLLNFILLGQIKTGILFATLFIFTGMFNMKNTVVHKKVLLLLYLLWIILSSFFICFLSQYILNEPFLSLGIEKILLNMCICLILFFIVLLITLHPLLSMSFIFAALILLSIVNFYIFTFKGMDLQPIDILAIQTAMNVASEYKIVIYNNILYGCLLAILYLFFSFGLPKLKIKKKIIARFVFAGVFIVTTLIFSFTSDSQVPYYWGRTGSEANGYFFNFALQVKSSFVKKPQHYSAKNIESIAENYKNSSASIKDEKKETPDIIVIMDESFTDFQNFGSDLQTNQEVTPFINSLKENTIRGYALTSVCGGGTPNSEYEFLSGNSMMFLPAGTMVYQQYLKKSSYSIVTEMKNNGYKCIAMHPFIANGWARNTVYPYLGFDETYFIEDFPESDIIRQYVSDKGMFQKIIHLYEENKKNQNNVFMFGVTMQNHGGYTYSGENYEQSISLEGYSQDYDNVEQYLSLIHETDSAVAYLLNYFENIEDDVVVVFYGDHIPGLGNFYTEIYGGTFNTLEEQQLQYTVPFFIWTNYDIEEETVELTSLNYLSSYMYKAAGLQLPEYNKVLSDIQEKIPALNVNGYYSLEKDTFLTYNEASGEEAELLNLYHQLVYNCLFDKNRNTILFPAIGSE